MTAAKARLQATLPASFSSIPTHQTKPVAIFELDQFVDDETYDELEATFPDLASVTYTAYDRGHKRYLNNRHEDFFEFLAKNAAWRSVYEFFDRPDTFDRLYACTAPHLGHRADAEQGPWVRVPPATSSRRRLDRTIERGLRIHAPLEKGEGPLASRICRVLDLGERLYAKSLSAAKRGVPVYLGFEFSILGNGDDIPPHNDIPSKLLSLMFYLPEKGVEYPRNAGTVFYTANDRRQPWRVWDSDMMDQEDASRFYSEHEPYYHATYARNRLVGFVKSDISWHAIPRLELPEGVLRRSVNINYFKR